ncbi:perosamine synthetase [Salinibacter ruber]|uniref:LegC family aminotransferase n=1 Tax=Salinibacter ruber TaxID=146919 RepID=UPI0021697FF1|nr:LegC family aminotransferase [Salinibacter ruber]MCS3655562.1 perosamine synthetase [Salinibacter ruber]MCS4168674.1 perosamine synthetase [Salinibacter ruber]
MSTTQNGTVSARVVEAIRDAIGPRDGFTPLHKPTFENNEWEYVKECIDTEWVSTAGSYVEQFEEDLAEYTGAEHAVVTVNGTAALHVSLSLAGVTPGDEVLVPALSFVATANAVAYLGATPHFVDSEERTLGLDPEKLGTYLHDIAEVCDGTCVNTQTGRPIKALVPMHAYGHPVALDALQEVAERYHLTLVEDAAESLGSLYEGTHAGTIGRLGALSFNGNKTITTGGGGAILTNDDELADEALHLVRVAKEDHEWEYFHDQTGYNYRMPNLNAALGCAQLEQMPSFLERKRALAECYRDAFEEVEGVSLFTERGNTRSNYWLNVLLLDKNVADRRDAVLAATNEADIMTRPTWQLLSSLPMYEDCPRMNLSTAESLERRLINIPSTPTLVDA